MSKIGDLWREYDSKYDWLGKLRHATMGAGVASVILCTMNFYNLSKEVNPHIHNPDVVLYLNAERSLDSLTERRDLFEEDLNKTFPYRNEKIEKYLGLESLSQRRIIPSENNRLDTPLRDSINSTIDYLNEMKNTGRVKEYLNFEIIKKESEFINLTGVLLGGLLLVGGLIAPSGRRMKPGGFTP